jgi:hypothetical protein
MGRGVHQARCKVMVDAASDTVDLSNYNDMDYFSDITLYSDNSFGSNDSDYDDYFRDNNIIENDTLKYAHLQEEFYNSSYSSGALRYSTNFDDFISRLPSYDNKDEVYNKLLQFSNETRLSKSNSIKLMELIRSFKPQIPVPSDIRVTKRFLLRKCKFMMNNLLRKTVDWPLEWNMSEYEQLGYVPEAVKVIALDPYEVVAYKLCDPILQFLYKDHIKYNYFSTTLDDGTKCWSHFMSSEYAKYTEEEVKSYNPDAILLPLIIYNDGVALGLRQKVINENNHLKY